MDFFDAIMAANARKGKGNAKMWLTIVAVAILIPIVIKGLLYLKKKYKGTTNQDVRKVTPKKSLDKTT